MRRSFVPTLAAVAAISAAAPAAAQGLNLTVDGIRNANGSVLVLVFDDARAFEQLDWMNAVQFADIPAKIGRITHRFADLTDGPYAVFVLHDENGDQNLNYSGQQLLEGTGATGVTASTPYPSFAKAAVRPGNVAIQIYYDQ